VLIPHRVPPNAVFHTPQPDPNNPKAGDWLQTWDGIVDLATFDAVVIGAPLSRSSLSHSGAYLLPSAIRRVLLDFSTYSSDYVVDLSPLHICDVGDIAMSLFDIVASHDYITEALTTLYATVPFVMLMGGDHSVTFPALRARSAVAASSLGLIQFDAHHDVRLLDAGPSNGTPIRAALQHGAVQGRHIAQVGIHGFSNAIGYAEWARDQGITSYTMPQIRQRGIMEVLGEAYQRASRADGGVYITVDMDVLERAVAPGCPASSPGGMTVADLCDGLYWLGQQERLVGIDFVEVDPNRDVADMTVKATCLAMLSFWAGWAITYK